MRCIVIAFAALVLFTIHAKDGDLSQTDNFKACARDSAIAEIKQAQQKGEIPAGGDMFVAIEPYTEKAYAACASLKPPGVTKPDGRPNDEIQDFVNTALFDILSQNAAKSRERE